MFVCWVSSHAACVTEQTAGEPSLQLSVVQRCCTIGILRRLQFLCRTLFLMTTDHSPCFLCLCFGYAHGRAPALGCLVCLRVCPVRSHWLQRGDFLILMRLGERPSSLLSCSQFSWAAELKSIIERVFELWISSCRCLLVLSGVGVVIELAWSGEI